MGTEKTAVVPKVDNSGLRDFASLLDSFGKMFGTGTQTTTKDMDPAVVAQANSLLTKIFADMDPANLDAMVGNILERARQDFGPNLIASNFAGLRGYSDTVVAQVQAEAVARAVGEAAKAKVDAINQGNANAAQVTGALLNNSGKTTTQTGASQFGKIVAGLGAGSVGMDLFDKLKKKFPTSDTVDSGTAGSNASGNGFNFGDGGPDGFSGANSATSGGDTFVSPPTKLLDKLLNSDGTLSPEEMAGLSGQADTGLTGAGELSEVDLGGLSAGSMGILESDAANALSGAGELSELSGTNVTNIMDIGGLDTSAAGFLSDADMQSLITDSNNALSGAGELSELGADGGVGSGATAVGGEEVLAGGSEIAGEVGVGTGAAVLAPAAVFAAAINAIWGGEWDDDLGGNVPLGQVSGGGLNTNYTADKV